MEGDTGLFHGVEELREVLVEDGKRGGGFAEVVEDEGEGG